MIYLIYLICAAFERAQGPGWRGQRRGGNTEGNRVRIRQGRPYEDEGRNTLKACVLEPEKQKITNESEDGGRNTAERCLARVRAKESHAKGKWRVNTPKRGGECVRVRRRRPYIIPKKNQKEQTEGTSRTHNTFRLQIFGESPSGMVQYLSQGRTCNFLRWLRSSKLLVVVYTTMVHHNG